MLRFLAINARKLAHLILLHRDLIPVVHLCAGDHVARCFSLLLELLAELARSLVHVFALILLLP